jgi:hypothetical protein
MRSARRDGTRARPAVRVGSRAKRGLLIAMGSLAVVVAAAGAVRAMVVHPSVAAQPHERSAGSARGTEPHPIPATSPSASEDPAPEPSATPDGTALADGTYPAYLGTVDVPRGTVTVDLVQIFTGTDAVRAAIQDGIARRDARQYRFFPVYVRDQNDLLRTLPVRSDARIRFLGECESPGDVHAALAELARRTTPFDTAYYYATTVENGEILGLVQRIALPAC